MKSILRLTLSFGLLLALIGGGCGRERENAPSLNKAAPAGETAVRNGTPPTADAPDRAAARKGLTTLLNSN